VYLGGRGGESSRPDRLDRGGPRMLQMAPHLNFPPVHCTKRSEAHAPVSPIPFAMMDTFQVSNASNVPTREKESKKRGNS
jgi:hypothetical protein